MARVKILLLWFAAAVAGLFAVVWALLAALSGSPRTVRVAVALDQAANAAIGGSEDETISSRAGKGAARGVWHWCLLCRVLDWIDKGHCSRNIEPDEGNPIDPPGAGQRISSPAQRGVFSSGGGDMAVTVKRKLWLALGVFAAGVLALFAIRGLAGVTLAAVLSGLSANALASATGAAGSKVAGVHAPAFVGAAAGSMMLWIQLRGRQKFDRIVLVLGAFLAAYYGGQLAAEIWPSIGAGGVGVAGTVCAYLIVPALEAALALLRDIGWIKRLISHRLGVDDVAAVPQSTEAGDKPVHGAGAGQ
jgi:hypothetical protein